MKELIYNNITDNNCMEEFTFAQLLILYIANRKKEKKELFQNHLEDDDYSDYYDDSDYNDES